jgi:hypothetical protein
MEKSDILSRADELLSMAANDDHLPELVQGTASLLALVYGRESEQLNAYKKQMERGYGKPDVMGRVHNYEAGANSSGALRNLKSEIDRGLVGDLRKQVSGEVLTDLIQLSRTVLSEQGDKAKSVAAVLAAAAFEDTVRRMGRTFAGAIGQDDLSEVLRKLKDAGVMLGPQVGIAQSYLNFRNHALHANWDKIEKESVHSVLGFVEQLLLKHFS